jgi:DDE superfamily endonuclease
VPEFIRIIYLPPNLTALYQPCDQGIIACIKVGYKHRVLMRLLDILDDDEKYRFAKQAKLTAKPGCVGIKHGEKPHILDALEILKSIWIKDEVGGGASTVGIQRCWLKSKCLPNKYHEQLRGIIPDKEKKDDKKGSTGVQDSPTSAGEKDELHLIVRDACDALLKLSDLVHSKFLHEPPPDFIEDSAANSKQHSDLTSMKPAELVSSVIEYDVIQEAEELCADLIDEQLREEFDLPDTATADDDESERCTGASVDTFMSGSTSKRSKLDRESVAAAVHSLRSLGITDDPVFSKLFTEIESHLLAKVTWEEAVSRSKGKQTGLSIYGFTNKKSTDSSSVSNADISTITHGDYNTSNCTVPHTQPESVERTVTDTHPEIVEQTAPQMHHSSVERTVPQTQPESAESTIPRAHPESTVPTFIDDDTMPLGTALKMLIETDIFSPQAPTKLQSTLEGECNSNAIDLVSDSESHSTVQEEVQIVNPAIKTITISKVLAVWKATMDPRYFEDSEPKGLKWNGCTCALDSDFSPWLYAYYQSSTVQERMRIQWPRIEPFFEHLIKRQVTYGQFKYDILCLFPPSKDCTEPYGMNRTLQEILDAYGQYIVHDDHSTSLFHVERSWRLSCQCGRVNRTVGPRKLLYVEHQFKKGTPFLDSLNSFMKNEHNQKGKCTRCHGDIVRKGTVHRLPVLLNVVFGPLNEKGQSLTTHVTHLPDIPKRFTLTDGDGNSFNYTLISFTFGSGYYNEDRKRSVVGGHFTCFINIHNNLFFYDGIPSGSMSFVETTKDVYTYEYLCGGLGRNSWPKAALFAII